MANGSNRREMRGQKRRGKDKTNNKKQRGMVSRSKKRNANTRTQQPQQEPAEPQEPTSPPTEQDPEIFLTETNLDPYQLIGGHEEDTYMTFASAESNGWEEKELGEEKRHPRMAPKHSGRYRVHAYVSVLSASEGATLTGVIWQQNGNNSQAVIKQYPVIQKVGVQQEGEGEVFDFGYVELEKGYTTWLALKSSHDVELDSSSWLDFKLVPLSGPTGDGDDENETPTDDPDLDDDDDDDEQDNTETDTSQEDGGQPKKGKSKWVIALVVLGLILAGLLIYFLVRNKKNKKSLGGTDGLEPVVPLSSF